MALIVLYDPNKENDRSDRIDGYPMSHADRHIHYWAMREGNPFQDLDVLWINRRYLDNEGCEIFHNITNVVYNNIDHMYIWTDSNVFDTIEGWLVDTDDGFELTEEQIESLRAYTCDDVFLAVEMTEHAVWGSNAFQRFSRIVQCVSNCVPVIYAVPEESFRGDKWGARGTHTPGQLHWWSLEDGAILETVEELLENNEDITRENIDTGVGFEIPPCIGPFGDVEFQEFSQWVHPFMLALWDTYNVPVYALELPCSYSYVPDGYGASGNQLSPLYSQIATCISHRRGDLSAEDYSTSFTEIKANVHARVIASEDIFTTRRNLAYDEICEIYGYPSTSFCSYGDIRDPTESALHFSLRGHGMGARAGANSIYTLEGDDPEERCESMLQILNNLSVEYGGGTFTMDPTFNPTGILGIVFNRQSILITRLSPTTSTYDVITHSNKVFPMIYLDYQFCRLDADVMERPNAGNASQAARRHIFGAFMQNITSEDYFSAEYWNQALQNNTARQRRVWAQRADILLFSDGIMLGEYWWPMGANQLADVPRIAE